MEDRTFSKQQTPESSSRSQYTRTPLDEARRSQNLSELSTTNTSPVNQYALSYSPTLSWEIPREHVSIEKIIGKGAFGQVAKGTATGLRGRPQKTLVAVKMLKGTNFNSKSFQRTLKCCCENKGCSQDVPPAVLSCNKLNFFLLKLMEIFMTCF